MAIVILMIRTHALWGQSRIILVIIIILAAVSSIVISLLRDMHFTSFSPGSFHSSDCRNTVGSRLLRLCVISYVVFDQKTHVLDATV